jgi:hypothetical protein
MSTRSSYMSNNAIAFLFLAILYLLYKGLYYYSRRDSAHQKSNLIHIINLEDMNTAIQNASIETATWDDISLGIFFDNEYQLSIPYYWEIYDSNSNLDKPIFTKDDYAPKNENDIEPNECIVLTKKQLINITAKDNLLIFNFKNTLLIIDINILDSDGSSLIAFKKPFKALYKLKI